MVVSLQFISIGTINKDLKEEKKKLKMGYFNFQYAKFKIMNLLNFI